MSKLIIGLFLLSLLCFTTAKINPPGYSQHDSRWGNKQLGESDQYTISEKGCLLSTMASMIAYKGIKVSGKTATPLTMNTYFRNEDQFSGGILFYKAPTLLGFKYEGIVTSHSTIRNAVNNGKFAHLHVLGGRHWVLVTEVVSGGYKVMDPGSGKIKTYDNEDVVGCAIYSYSSKNRNLAQDFEADDTAADTVAHIDMENGWPHFESESESADIHAIDVDAAPANPTPKDSSKGNLRKRSAQ